MLRHVQLRVAPCFAGPAQPVLGKAPIQCALAHPEICGKFFARSWIFFSDTYSFIIRKLVPVDRLAQLHVACRSDTSDVVRRVFETDHTIVGQQACAPKYVTYLPDIARRGIQLKLCECIWCHHQLLFVTAVSFISNARENGRDKNRNVVSPFTQGR
ncbi:hypothetical protein A9R05_08430 [Burkholderia sp. KK1]|nr:hypothetical protein A9R05_08430 [Burkholderia sp. KK1]